MLAWCGCVLDAQALVRDGPELHEANALVEKVGLEIDRQAKTDNQFYKFDEASVARDDHISQYRWRHFASVSRHEPQARRGWIGGRRLVGYAMRQSFGFS
jgi:tryptophan 2,3-dioxygenase